MQPGNAADSAGPADRRFARADYESQPGGREIEQVRARRVERADLVRSILQRKRVQPDAAVAAGSDAAVAGADAVPAQQAGMVAVRAEDLQWRVPQWDDALAARIVAGEDVAGEDVAAADVAAGVVPASPAVDAHQQDPGAQPSIGANADDWEMPTTGSGPDDQGDEPDAVGAVSGEPIAIDHAASPALEMLGKWWREDCAARYEIERAKQAEPNARRRAKLDADSELNLAMRSEGGEAFMLGLVDDVLRPDDLLASGFGLSDLADRIPDTLSARARRGFQIGAFAGPGVPFIAVPAVRKAARRLFGSAIITGDDEALTKASAVATELGASVRVTPLTDTVLGDHGVHQLRERLRALVSRADVHEVELTWRDLVPNGSAWDFVGACERTAMQLADLAMAARQARPPQAGPPVRLMVRATCSRDAEAVVETCMRAMKIDGMHGSLLGVALPVDLPECSSLIRRLAGSAHMHREEGGLPLRVNLFRMTDRGVERVDARLHEWKIATFVDDADVDANMVRCIDTVLGTEHHGVLELELDVAPAMDAVLAASLAAQRRALARVSVIVPNGVDAATLRRIGEIGALPSVRIAQLPGDDLRPATGYARTLIQRAGWAERERLAQLAEVTAIAQAQGTAIAEITSGKSSDAVGAEPVPQPAATHDGYGPQQERLLTAISRMHQLPAGKMRTQSRVAPEDAPGITAAIELELFPDGLFDDEAGSDAVGKDASIDAPNGVGGAQSAASGTELSPADAARSNANTTVLGNRDGSASGFDFDDADADDETGAHPETGDGARVYDTQAQRENPADTGAAPNLTEVVLGLRRGRILRNTFRNAPDSDPTLPEIRDWARAIQRRCARSQLGIDEAASHHLHSIEQVTELIERANAAGTSWRETSGWERAAQLEQLAKAIDANRARLIEVAMSETCLTFAEVDSDVSRCVDLANYYAHLARQLDRMQGASFDPVRITLVIPGWVPPVSSVANGLLSALAAGSAAILVPAPRSERTAAIFARVLWATDLPGDLVQLAGNDHQRLSEDQLARELIVDERVERVLMQGHYETAAHFLAWRSDLPMIGASGGKSSAIVTPAADYDLAARDIATSVISSGGQNPLRPSVVILVGAAGRSERFTEQLADALASKRVGYPSDPVVDAGPLVSRADPKAMEQLTSLAEGERWILEPRSVDDTGRLWTAGIRVGLTRESTVLTNDAMVPVVNLVTVRTLREAIELQNDLDCGLGASLFSLDRAEIAEWVQGVEAGNLYVNRDVIGMRVQQQPIGGWNRSMIGTKLKTGGPNSLMHLGRWRAEEHEQSNTLHLRGLETPISRLIEALQGGLKFEEFERVRRTALSCQIAWNETFGEVTDISNLRIERNLFRYRPAPCLIRFSSDAKADELGQVLVAAVAARAPIMISSAWELPTGLARELEQRQASVRIESDDEFLARLRSEGLREAPRMRLLGGSRKAVQSALKNAVDIALFSDDVTLAGLVEMLPFLREQSISITAHRHGNVDERVFSLFPHETIVDPDASLLGK